MRTPPSGGAGGHARAAHQLRQNLLRLALMGQLSAGDDGDLVGDLQNALLMGDDDHGAVQCAAQTLEDGDEVVETPQVDAGLRLVEDGQPRVAQKHRGDLYALDLAAGEGGVDLAVDVFARAQPHLAEHVAEPGLGGASARGQFQKLTHHQPLEAHRLLEGVADAAPGALGDVQVGNVLAVEQYAPALGLFQTGDDLGQRGLAAAVGPGDYGELSFGDAQAHIPQHLVSAGGGPGNMLQFQHNAFSFLGLRASARRGFQNGASAGLAFPLFRVPTVL